MEARMDRGRRKMMVLACLLGLSLGFPHVHRRLRIWGILLKSSAVLHSALDMSRPRPEADADANSDAVAVSASYPPIRRGGSLIIAWQLKGKQIVLIGGGEVAAGRLVNVLNADAIVTLICPSSGLCPEVRHRIWNEKLVDRYVDRPFGGPEDLEGADMVLTAIDDAALSRSICTMCRERRIPVNVADVPPECDFFFGSIMRDGPLQVMVSTGGKGPRIANQIRRRIQASLPANVGQAIERVGQLRQELRKRAPEPELGPRRMQWMVDVCDGWTLDELCQMNDEAVAKVLQGWETGSVPRYRDVIRGGGVCGYVSGLWDGGSWLPARESVLPSFAGFALGAVIGIITYEGYLRRRL